MNIKNIQRCKFTQILYGKRLRWDGFRNKCCRIQSFHKLFPDWRVSDLYSICDNFFIEFMLFSAREASHFNFFHEKRHTVVGGRGWRLLRVSVKIVENFDCLFENFNILIMKSSTQSISSACIYLYFKYICMLIIKSCPPPPLPPIRRLRFSQITNFNFWNVFVLDMPASSFSYFKITLFCLLCSCLYTANSIKVVLPKA